MKLVKDLEKGINIDKEMIHIFNTNPYLIAEFKKDNYYAHGDKNTLWEIADYYSDEWGRSYSFINKVYKMTGTYKLLSSGSSVTPQ